MSDTLRSQTLRMASELPKGDPTRRKLLTALQGKTAARGQTWNRILNDQKKMFLEQVAVEAEDIVFDAGGRAKTKVHGQVATLAGQTADGDILSVEWSWSGPSMIVSQMVLGRKHRKGKHMVLSMAPMNVAAESLFKHFQGLLLP